MASSDLTLRATAGLHPGRGPARYVSAYNGVLRRSRGGKALTPAKADLAVKAEGWLRPALVVNGDGPVPALSLDPKTVAATYIHVHNGGAKKRGSEGCRTLAPVHLDLPGPLPRAGGMARRAVRRACGRRAGGAAH